MMNMTQRRNATEIWRRAKLTAYSAVILAIGGGIASASEYYVATTGNDGDEGSIGSPWLTLEHAQTAVRSAGASNATIYVRGGTYPRARTLALTYQDSGETWSAYPSETPVLIGALPITNWSGTTIKVTDVSTQGITATFNELYWNGSRQWKARKPNYNAVDPIYGGFAYVNSGGGGSSIVADTSFNPETPAQIVGSPQLQNMGWDQAAVTSISGTTVNYTPGARGAYGNNTRFFIQGQYAELDAAGEWWLDGSHQYLYFYPSNAITTATVYAPRLDKFVTIAGGSSNITWRGFTMKYNSDVAIDMTGTTNCLIAQNIISHGGGFSADGAGGSGIQLVGGFTNGIIGNDISHLGSYGIRLYGGDSTSSSTTLYPCNNYVDNNYIHHVGLECKSTYGSAIVLFDPAQANNVGIRVSRNTIHDLPRIGIFFVGQNIMIQSNHIYNVMKDTDDGGVIYSTSTDWRMSGWGSHIDNNYLHGAQGWGINYGTGVYQATYKNQSSGIYLDFATGGVVCNSNIITDCSLSGIFWNGGSDNRATNNVLVNNQCLTANSESFSMQVGGFAVGSDFWTTYGYGVAFNSGHDSYDWSRYFPGWAIDPGNFTSTTTTSNRFWKNIIVNLSPYSQGKFLMYNNPVTSLSFDNNVYFNTVNPTVMYISGNGSYPLSSWRSTYGQDVNSITSDPMLNNDYSLNNSSPAFALGINSITTNGIGCYRDSYRASWPPGFPTVLSRPLAPTGLKLANL